MPAPDRSIARGGGRHRSVEDVGLDHRAASAAAGSARRQKGSIARSVLERPEMPLVDEAMTAFDFATLGRVPGELGKRTLIWHLPRARLGESLEWMLVVDAEGIVEEGRFVEPESRGGRLAGLLVGGA